MGHKLEKWEAMPTCCRLTFCVASFVSQLTVFLKLCIKNTILHFLLCQSCRNLRNISLGDPHIPLLGLIKKSYRGWLSMMTSSEGSFSASLPAPSTLSKCTTACSVQCWRSWQKSAELSTDRHLLVCNLHLEPAGLR